MFTSAEGENEVQPMVTNEREKGEKVHMRGGKAKGGRTFACLRRFCTVSGNKRQTRKKFRSRVLRECT